MRAIPYLFFGGECGNALDFYRETLGAEVKTVVRFRDMPGAAPKKGDQIMHAEFSIGSSMVFASDAQEKRSEPGGFAVSLEVANDTEAQRLYQTISRDGKVDVPLINTPFASSFCMVTDRFGTPWMISALKQ